MEEDECRNEVFGFIRVIRWNSRFKIRRMRKVAVGARIACGCRLVNWERQDLGNKIVRVCESETNTYERSPGVGLSG